jgi:zinc transporter ZupT
MYARQFTNEEQYTVQLVSNALSENEKRKKERKAKLITQKLLGLCCVIGAIIAPFILEGEITVTLFMLPLGLGTMLTKEVIIL